MFLTLEDPRAKIQGSRDPLGVEPIWSRFGREVVTNLTTVSRAARGFAVLLLGRYFGEFYVSEGRANEEDVLPIFLRLEQIAAYARHAATSGREDDIVLGVTRVKRFLHEYEGKVPIQDSPAGFILSDQRTYGLWGLYSVAARVSGLLADGPVGLTPVAREFVEAEYLPSLAGVKRQLDRLLLEGGTLDTTGHAQPYTAVKKLLTGSLSVAERDFYGRFLRDACSAERTAAAARQRQLAELLRMHGGGEAGAGRDLLSVLITEARRSGNDSLAEKLGRILRLEAVLAPAECLFELLQARNGQSPAALASKVADHWGTRVPHLDTPLEPLIAEIQAAAGEEQTALIAHCDQALGRGDYGEAIQALLDWNQVVMAARGSAPWIKVSGGKIDVRFRGNERPFPTGDELPNLWRNSYFIDSLRDVTLQLEGGTNAGK